MKSSGKCAQKQSWQEGTHVKTWEVVTAGLGWLKSMVARELKQGMVLCGLAAGERACASWGLVCPQSCSETREVSFRTV